jgi:mannose/fructose/N-acetylgalactosamine-specific phosphotransferase system component IIC
MSNQDKYLTFLAFMLLLPIFAGTITGVLFGDFGTGAGWGIAAVFLGLLPFIASVALMDD